MGKLLRFVGMLLILCILLLGVSYAYAQPDRLLDLNYSEISVRDKLTDMLANRRLEVVLTESEVNDLLKKTLSSRAQLNEDWKLSGAQFNLKGNQWTADVTLMYKDKWPIGAQLFFTVKWEDPFLTATHTGTQIKQLSVPMDWFQLQPLQIPLNDYLPKPAGIRAVTFQDNVVRLALRRR
ncbi:MULTISPECIES: hypothetical protein [Paenibacillus]|jgi:hypothetical protein|uniref:Uncharacterized protein n=1 Tax=Paenibacillus baimaensis TaxID=2982185 RepID=A0ABT2UPR1_9BACL|nr:MULTISPECIES: hypothetical protein [unclassified Paenibacillus]MCU6796648.1 hypothetical protein [Paenibacillus sp. WQ 127069]OMF14835.1 hypothetical protein BK127_16620 [Paenibacillus sp. FSL H7-0331]